MRVFSAAHVTMYPNDTPVENAHTLPIADILALPDCGRSFSKAAYLNDQPYDPNGFHSPFSGRVDDCGYAPREQAGARVAGVFETLAGCHRKVRHARA